MVGQYTVTKPSRSDEVLDVDQQLRIANEIKAQFESIAPKRPVKPNRSDPDSSTSTPVDSTAVDQNIPELNKFQALQSQSHVCHMLHLNLTLFLCVRALWLFLGFVVLVIGLSDCCKISRLCFRQRELLGHKKSMWRPSTTTSCTQLINSITRLHINLIIYMFRF